MAAFEQLKTGLARYPRASIGIFPTALQFMQRLSQHFRRPVYFKRDDLAGVALGGSKVRILQFTAADALAQGADAFVAAGYAQSNHPAQVAAVGAKLGIVTYVIIDVTKGYEAQGNVLLADLAGARVSFTAVGNYEGLLAECRRLAAHLVRAGCRPQIMTQTRESRVLSAVAYAAAFIELYEQLQALDIRRADVVVGSGGPTYAGLLLGALATGRQYRVYGVPPRGRGSGAREEVKGFIAEAAARLGADVRATDRDVAFLSDTSGVYGEVDRDTIAAVRFVAAHEGVCLDPVYGGHAMAALLRHRVRLAKGRPLVFVQTGGAPAIFAYERELATRRILKHESVTGRVDRTAGKARSLYRSEAEVRRRRHPRFLTEVPQ